MKQSLVADYAKHAEKMFLMVKTGATVLWDRLPIHLVTTLTRVPNFALYADVASSVGGYEVIDVLENVTQLTKEHDQFKMYRQLHKLRDIHGAINPSETTVEGGWDLDKFKNLPMLLHAYRTAPHLDWFVFMDADSYFMLDNLMDYLNTLDPNKPLYIGCAIMYGKTMFNHGGSGVVLSRKALEISVGKHPEWVTEAEPHTIEVCCGDYMVAHMLLKANVKPERAGSITDQFQGESYQKMTFNKWTWCSKVVSFHHLRPSDVETLWEYERLIGPERRKNILFGDIYRDFVAPYIHETMNEWDNLARQTVFSEAKEQVEELDKDLPEPRPWKSIEACRQACQNSDGCLAWKFLPHARWCAIDENIRLGKPYFDWIDYKDSLDHHEVTSGFMVDRIRELRSGKKCDVLHKKKGDDLAKDEFREGWYRRLQLLEQEEKKTKEAEKKLENAEKEENEKNKGVNKAIHDAKAQVAAAKAGGKNNDDKKNN